ARCDDGLAPPAVRPAPPAHRPAGPALFDAAGARAGGAEPGLRPRHRGAARRRRGRAAAARPVGTAVAWRTLALAVLARPRQPLRADAGGAGRHRRAVQAGDAAAGAGDRRTAAAADA